MDEKTIGKRLIIGIIVFLLGLDTLLAVIFSSLYYAMGNILESNHEILQGIFRLILGALFSFFLYKKHKWAKWALVGLFIISGISLLIAGVIYFEQLLALSIIIAVLGILNLLCAGLLLFNSSVKAYMRKDEELKLELQIADEAKMNETQKN